MEHEDSSLSTISFIFLLLLACHLAQNTVEWRATPLTSPDENVVWTLGVSLGGRLSVNDLTIGQPGVDLNSFLLLSAGPLIYLPQAVRLVK